jgi:2-amino-4-hydroxy-6-hydroxymethyldihydropteridine diphosphokinase
VSYRAAVALGSNLGDRLGTLRRATEALGELGILIGVSSLYETEPVGGPEQAPYLNAVVVVDIDLPPIELLAALHEIENREGRVRDERWGPRTLDLDIVTMLDASSAAVAMDTPDLTLPHPRAHERRFVLEPLTEVWPEAPIGTASARHALGEVGTQGMERLGEGWTGSAGSTPALLLAVQLGALAVYGGVLVTTARLPPDAWQAVIAVVLAVGGVALTVLSAARLGAALTPLPEPKPGSELVDSGPYRWVRHPIYLGIVIALIGLAIGGGSLPALVVAVGIGVFFWFKAGFEESRLRLLVSGYPDYMRRVGGRLWPRRPRQTAGREESS